MKKLPLLLSFLLLLGCGNKQKATDTGAGTNKTGVVKTDTGKVAAVTETYKTLFNDGINFYNTKQYEDAVAAFKKSDRLSPNSKTDYYIALSYNVMKNCDSSVVYAQKVLKTGNDNNEYTNNSTKMIAACSPAVVNNTDVTTDTHAKYEFDKKVPAKDFPVFTRTDSVKFKIINTHILQNQKLIQLKPQVKHF
jgi:tetratricopeptide (TPR) repeat protein